MYWLVGLFLKRLMKGRSVEQIHTVFWAIVILLAALFLIAWLLQPVPDSAPR